ncbi:hypothetical protein Pst134EA_019275 [Puccinia striiformis f. sp. tritici]|uniref:hypothetical protein n=1 Tax=Puccinia striiformis f. sp. tritici TaxID=168172 RepID=UPI002007AC02|nr:hypothetical protein Pst134EA_019275 [Puccinia striiformis f. sp. tritici]KAH9459119.1 hypothetical protein Pst134EA_019275 [Puccinia striiformis f. sp. tritici]
MPRFTAAGQDEHMTTGSKYHLTNPLTTQNDNPVASIWSHGYAYYETHTEEGKKHISKAYVYDATTKIEGEINFMICVRINKWEANWEKNPFIFEALSDIVNKLIPDRQLTLEGIEDVRVTDGPGHGPHRSGQMDFCARLIFEPPNKEGLLDEYMRRGSASVVDTIYLEFLFCSAKEHKMNNPLARDIFPNRLEVVAGVEKILYAFLGNKIKQSLYSLLPLVFNRQARSTIEAGGRYTQVMAMHISRWAHRSAKSVEMQDALSSLTGVAFKDLTVKKTEEVVQKILFSCVASATGSFPKGFKCDLPVELGKRM